ncbi:Putative peptidoglycan binding domain-containing protein [Desulfotomaculum arcticum]|uniref:Putative peptidoglycan binding domain-containing protein n=1 Tax=Desulfotruncus arcticus DSM 17038 TaxID=1121424 RepID=A0A1I2WSS2_9FIRM|nr:L,D-transpeptidase family protein [Desulfotruncus arcticus]SFH04252.1 Putative peptidoglycan binding domain-containing protein [Desulfotomaculum arcticum] [Desulfotruncus arcticus DSM 17038]
MLIFISLTAAKTPARRELSGDKLEISATKVQVGSKPHLNQVFFIEGISSMKNININKLFKSRFTRNIILIISIYLLISLYFVNHFFFNTVINRVNVSFKAHDDVDQIMRSYVKDYKLQLIERDGKTEEITGQAIRMQYNEDNSLSEIYRTKNALKWLGSLFKGQKYYVNDLFFYNADDLDSKINDLNCLNNNIIEPRNVGFKYSNGSYEMVEEVYGNKILKDKLHEVIKTSILNGELKMDLNEKLCYENPKYTVNSAKTPKTKDLLNRYVAVKINYKFGDEDEILDGDKINEWLSVDENLDVVINKNAVMKYVNELSRKYDTVGIARNFKTSTGKIIEVKGGLYGWKINQEAETEALLENIIRGESIEKEPVYAQKALSRGEDEIGNTYVEINITRQHLWFYKDGKLITQGPIVTGNPNRGNATVTGTFMLNYKQKSTTLRGAGYAAEVKYWMPFYGNVGIHDASWRYAFGGQIYKSAGTHGCINAPLHLAKAIFDNIEEGVPIISYEE